MVKLTPELIEQCASYTNPVKDREIDFRGKDYSNIYILITQSALDDWWVGGGEKRVNDR